MLRTYRETAGLSLENVAYELKRNFRTVHGWEKQGHFPKGIYPADVARLEELLIDKAGGEERSGLKPGGLVSAFKRAQEGKRAQKQRMRPLLPEAPEVGIQSVGVSADHEPSEALSRTDRRPPSGSVPSLPGKYVERPEDISALKDLVFESRTAGQPVALVGMGGAGKTVLAEALGADPQVRDRFRDGVAWVAVGSQPSLAAAQYRLAVQFGHGGPFGANIEENRLHLAKLLEGRACLVILDDVWDSDAFAAFDALPSSSRLVVTTRDRGLAGGWQSWEVSQLGFDQSLAVLARWVGVEPHQLPPQADSLCLEVGHLALGVATVGALVAAGGGGPTWGPAWTDVLTRLLDADPDRVGAKFANYQHATLLRAIDVSLDFLTIEERQRYHELAVFDGQLPVPRIAVEALWAPASYSSPDTGDLLRTLAARSLLTLDERQQVSLHDLQHDVATYYLRQRSGGVAGGHAQLLDGYRQRIAHHWSPPSDTALFPALAQRLTGLPVWDPLWRAATDGYLLDHLAEHLAAAGSREELHDLLVDYAWLDLGLVARNVTALLADYSRDSDDDTVQTVRGALQLSAHAIGEDRFTLPGQLLGRLLDITDLALRPLLQAAATSRPGPWLRPRRATLTPPGGPLLLTLIGHKRPVDSVAITSAGGRAVTASRDHTARVWDVASGHCEHVLEGHTSEVVSVAVTSDGTRAVTGSVDDTARVWNLASGRCEHVLEGHKLGVGSVAVSADGTRAITGSEDHDARVWDVASGRCEHVLEGHKLGVGSVAVSADGARAVTGSEDHDARVWDLASGHCEHVLEGHKLGVGSVAVSADGARAVTGSEDHDARVWDVASGHCEHVLEGHTSGVVSVAVTSDGARALTASADHDARVWDVASGRCEHVLEGHKLGVWSVAVSADGTRAVTGSEDHDARVWDLASGRCEHVLEGHKRDIGSVAVSAHGIRAITGSEDDTARVWNLASKRRENVLGDHKLGVGSVAVSADGTRAVTGSRDRTARVWDVASGRCEHVLQGHKLGVGSVAVSADGARAVTGSEDHDARVWDLASGRCEHVLEGHKLGVGSVAVSADGTRAVTGSEDHDARVWDLASGRCKHVLEGHKLGVWSVAVSADGTRAVTGSEDHDARVWDLASGRCEHVLKGHKRVVWSVAVSADGARAVTGSEDHDARVWDLASGRCEHVLKGHKLGVGFVAITADGVRAITSSEDHTVRVWDVASGRCEHVLEGLEGLTSDVWVAVTSDGAWAVTADPARVWNLSDGQQGDRWVPDGVGFSCVAASQLLARVVFGDPRGRVHIFDLGDDQPTPFAQH